MSQFKKYQSDFEVVNDLTGLRRYLADWHEHEYLALEKCPRCQSNGFFCTFRYFQGKHAFKTTCESCAGRKNSGCNTRPCRPWPTQTFLSASCVHCSEGSCLSQLPIKAQSVQDIIWNANCVQCSNNKQLTCVFPPKPSKQREDPVDHFEGWRLGSPLFRHKNANVYYFTGPIDSLEEESDGLDPGTSYQAATSTEASSGSNDSKVPVGAPSAFDSSKVRTAIATGYDVGGNISQEEMRNRDRLTAWARSGDSRILDHLELPW